MLSRVRTTASQLRVIGLAVGLGLIGGGLVGWIVRADLSASSAADFLWAVALWVTTYLTLVHCYLFGFFNPGESARRIRLVVELRAAGRRGVTVDEILKAYNARTIVAARLDRLMGAGQIVERNGRYFIGRSLMLSLAKVMVFLKLVFFGARTEFDVRRSTAETRGRRVAVS